MAIFPGDPSDPALGSFFAALIGLLRRSNANLAIPEYLRQWEVPFSHFVFVPATNDRVGFCWWRSADRLVIAIDGSSTLRQQQRFVTGAQAGLTGTITSDTNDMIESDVTHIISSCDALFHDTSLAIYTAGWSIGGNLALKVALLSPGNGFNERANNCITFGSPRFASHSTNRILNAKSRVTRWMNDGDFAPFIFPRIGEVPLMSVAFLLHDNVRFGNFSQPVGGLRLTLSGEIVAAALPRVPAAGLTANLVAFLGAATTDPTNPHAILKYYDSLVRATPLARPLGSTSSGGQDDDAVVTNQEIRRAQQVVVANISNVVRDNASIIVDIPPQFRARAVRVNRIWLVQLNGQTIGICPSKRKARQVARTFNFFMDSLQTAGAVDVLSMVAQFQEYLNAAGSPTGGFLPVMHTIPSP